MNTKNIFSIGCSLFFNIIICIGQTICYTPAGSFNNARFDSFNQSVEVEEYYNLRIYVHVIRTSQGTGGQTSNEVSEALDFLEVDFNPHGIFFTWDGNIDYIDNDTYYNNPSTIIYTINSHFDGIDIYLFDDLSASGGRANGVGESSEFWVSGSFWEEPFNSLVKSHVISHEMGHVLFLYHTHHGTFEEGGDPNQCPEYVDGSNSSFCGDYVVDTPADPHLQFNVDYTTCDWKDVGFDGHGDSYSPDESLIMSYTHPSCMNYFSDGQGERMKTAIETLPFLQAVVIECEKTIVSNRTIDSDEIIDGCDVLLDNVTILNNADVIIEASNTVLIDLNFEAKVGSTLEIR